MPVFRIVDIFFTAIILFVAIGGGIYTWLKFRDDPFLSTNRRVASEALFEAHPSAMLWVENSDWDERFALKHGGDESIGISDPSDPRSFPVKLDCISF